MNDTLQTAVDSVKNTADKSADNSWILLHIMDGNYLDFSPFGKIYLPEIQFMGIDISITRHVVFLWIAALIVFFLFRMISKSYTKSLVPKGVTNFFEVFIIFVRDEIAKPTIGKGYEKFLPYLLSVFFFILISNFLGLVPFSATITSNISVTAVLAIFSFGVIQIGGIKKNGFFGYFKGLIPHGVPVFLLPIMMIVEFLGLFTKPFALAIRLFANLTAGHIIIYALISLIFVMQTFAVVPISIGMALFIYTLELLVCLLQAFIFTMLSSLFIGMAVHQDH
ncbi:MAG: ATP synthase F0 subunit A [Chlorobiaceae bacterium]|nr:ATP synthase F0 subunit A [Chlorobiaceae bacterium]MBA4310275.1 ATP synthase F0 subunit A [Chlorobiaceae bacterium]